MAVKRAALISICHGAGPLPVLQDPTHRSLIHELSVNVPKLLKLGTPEAPKAIVVLTAHWQTRIPAISSEKQNKLYYDYYGFPKEGYDIEHNAYGAPEVAHRVFELLRLEGIEAQLDSTRGWDHGTFVPMKMIDPAASIPIVQVSILASQDAPSLLRMGRALAQLRHENVAILGSGSPSYHDVRIWMTGLLEGDDDFAQRQDEWHAALERVLREENKQNRLESLTNWRQLPHAYEMHPKGAAEHFNTLLICAGAAGDAKVHLEKVEVMGALEATCWWD